MHLAYSARYRDTSSSGWAQRPAMEQHTTRLPWTTQSGAGSEASDAETFFEEESETSSESEPVEPPLKTPAEPPSKRARQEITRAENFQVKRVKESFEAEVVRSMTEIPAPELSAIQACVQSLPSKVRLFPPCISYCYQWMMGKRRCGKTCKYLHRKLPGGSVAKSIATQSLGQFAIEDSSKQVSNWVLHDVASDLEEQRCFVLDGAKGGTVNTLQRPREGVLSPNVDARATTALQATSLSMHASSFTTLVVALHARVHFGCVYLDYMWPLDYFESTQREAHTCLSKQRGDTALRGGTSERLAEQLAACHEYATASLTDGIHDVELLVLDPGHSLLSPSGAVLAVTMVHSQTSSLRAQRRRLERVLVEGAQLHQASLDFMGYTKPSNRPVATYFYGWNLQCKLSLLPNVSKKLQKHCFFHDSRRLHSADSKAGG